MNKGLFILIGIIVILASLLYIVIAGLLGLIFGVLGEFFGGDVPLWAFGIYFFPGLLGLPAGIFLMRRKRWLYSLIFGSVVFFYPPVQLFIMAVATNGDTFSSFDPMMIPYGIALLLGILFVPLMLRSKQQFR